MAFNVRPFFVIVKTAPLIFHTACHLNFEPHRIVKWVSRPTGSIFDGADLVGPHPGRRGSEAMHLHFTAQNAWISEWPRTSCIKSRKPNLAIWTTTNARSECLLARALSLACKTWCCLIRKSKDRGRDFMVQPLQQVMNHIEYHDSEQVFPFI